MAVVNNQRLRVALLALLTMAIFVPLLLNHTYGADLPRYFMWAKAFNERDIFCLEGSVLSPSGVPLSQWSFGPGLIFSLGSLGSGFTPGGAVVVGWIFIVIFWCSYVGVLLHVTNNNYALALLGACITSIGTPIGYYSSAYSSESLSYACLSVLIYWIVSRTRFSDYDYLIMGIWASLLIGIRIQLALYVVPVYLVVLYRIGDGIASTGRPLMRLIWRGVIFHLPIVLALLAITTVNSWMTGSPYASAYDFGSATFKSADFLHPELLAVLVHPWHGLLAYHPLYLLVFLAFVLSLAKRHDRSSGALFLVVAAVMVIHVYVHASWYVWWLGGNTFGMRGLSICGIILVPILLRRMAEREARSRSNNVLLAVLLLVNLWSFVLLTQGPTQYYTYQQLFSGVASALYELIGLQVMTVPLVVFILGTIFALLYGKTHPAACFKNIVIAVLLSLVIQYQLMLLLHATVGMALIALVSMVLLLVVMICYPVVIGELQKYAHVFRTYFMLTSVAGFIVLIIMFVRLAVPTNQMIAGKNPAPRPFSRVGTFDIDEVRESYLEYLNVPGFDANKTRLAAFIEQQGK